ncbi:hypothetical protein [Pseudomonas abieticivorans]|uniref:hypothetical protein n=1 Tax=Pseudomonas abieticivorans TaxID=2931382 RepID=UPI0020BE9848|nr:hypothetical protein [Pseudomonas sp. PIA16]
MNSFAKTLRDQHRRITHPAELYHDLPATLAAPWITSIEHGGLNRAELFDPLQPVIVLVYSYLNRSVGDLIQMYWGDNPLAVGELEIGPEHLSSEVVPVHVAPSPGNIPDGQWEVHYHVIRVSGNPAGSHPLSIRAKRTVPGNPDPEPATPYINENLTPPEGIPSNPDASTALTVEIPRYLYISEGDVITLHWSGVQLSKTVSATEAATPSLKLYIQVPADVIADNPGSNLVVRYDIRDTVNNWSLFSLERRVNVVRPGAFPPPVVDQAPGDVLNIDTLNGADVSVLVLVYPHFEVGTTFRLAWTGQPIFGPPVEVEFFRTVTDRYSPVSVTLSNADAARLVGTIAQLYYEAEVIEPGNPLPVLRRSDIRTLTVEGTLAELALPIVVGAVGGVLDPDRIVGSSQEVIIQAWSFMGFPQTVSVFWDGETAAGSGYYRQETVTIEREAQVGRDVSVFFDKEFANVLRGGKLQVSYRIQAGGQSYTSPTLALTVGGIINNLPAPTTDPFFPGGDLDLGQVGNFITVNIADNAFFQPGDIIVLNSTGSGGVDYSSQLPYPGTLSAQLGKTPYLDGNLDGLVALDYEVHRNGLLVGTSTALTLAIRLSGGQPWPLPTVQDATGSTVTVLNPIKPGTANEPNTATVLINDARILAGDTVAVTWLLQGVDQVVPWVLATAGAAQVPVPDLIVTRSMGKTAVVNYTIYRGVFPDLTLVGTSLPIDLPVLQMPAGVLPTPLFEPLTAGRLDLNHFAGDGVVVVPPWPRIAEGQTVWMRVSGTDDRNEPWTEALYVGKAVTAAELSAGLRRALPRAWLLRLQNGSSLVVTMSVGFDNGLSEGEAIMFPQGDVELLQVELELIAPTVENEVDGRLDPELVPTAGVTVTVPTFSGMAPGQKISVDWTASDNDFYTTAEQEVAAVAPLNFLIPKRISDLSTDERVSVAYNVRLTAEAMKNTSRPVPFELGKAGRPSYPTQQDFEDEEPRIIRQDTDLGLLTVRANPVSVETSIESNAPENLSPFITGKALKAISPSILSFFNVDFKDPVTHFKAGISANNYISIRSLEGNYKSIPWNGTGWVELSGHGMQRIISFHIASYAGTPVYMDNITVEY